MLYLIYRGQAVSKYGPSGDGLCLGILARHFAVVIHTRASPDLCPPARGIGILMLPKQQRVGLMMEGHTALINSSSDSPVLGKAPITALVLGQHYDNDCYGQASMAMMWAFPFRCCLDLHLCSHH